MPIQILNSLTKKKEVLKPLDPNGRIIRMYACGVTVYDQCHIGHARSLYVFEVIRRYLEVRGFDVRFVRNITDVDDKIINKAQELNVTSQQLAEDNIAGYQADLKSLGLEPAHKEPRATENIPEMVLAIQGLMNKGYAYENDGDVYYDVRKFPSYGKLSHQSPEKMHEAVRIEKDLKKKDPLDFALWKKSKPGEPAWESPWGPGRPGWHIECSCMSLKHLECETLDIHAGGRDLIFPHHENEIAQAEPLTGKPFARVWIHHGLLTINGQKMAKSLGNFITIQDALKKYSADTLKMFFLFSHYASPIDYSEEKMLEAQKAWDRFDVLFWKTHELLKDKQINQPVEMDFVREHKDAFFKAMDDDFNTPVALACLFEMINATNKWMEEGTRDRAFYEKLYGAVDTLEHLARGIFGLFLQEKEVELSPEDLDLIDRRKKARAQKDFKLSDELRDELKRRGIALEDTKLGQTWRKV